MGCVENFSPPLRGPLKIFRPPQEGVAPPQPRNNEASLMKFTFLSINDAYHASIRNWEETEYSKKAIFIKKLSTCSRAKFLLKSVMRFELIGIQRISRTWLFYRRWISHQLVASQYQYSLRIFELCIYCGNSCRWYSLLADNHSRVSLPVTLFTPAHAALIQEHISCTDGIISQTTMNCWKEIWLYLKTIGRKAISFDYHIPGNFSFAQSLTKFTRF